MDWKPGDLALCINGDPCPVFGPTGLVKDSVYLVIAVKEATCRETGLCAVGLKLAGINSKPPWRNQVLFRKLPPAPDAFDHEVIAALKSEPVHVPQHDALHNGCQCEVSGCLSLTQVFP